MTEFHHPASPKTAALDMEKWRVIISDWESSQESQKQYCKRLGIHLNTFTYARSKLTKAKKLKPAFVPVTLVQSEGQKLSNTDTVIIENPQGLKLHISLGLPLERLTTLFKLCGWLNA